MSAITRLGFGDKLIIRRAGIEAEAVVGARYGEPAKVVLLVGTQSYVLLESELLASLPPEVVEVDIAQAERLADLVLSGKGSHMPVSSQLRSLSAAVKALMDEMRTQGAL